MNLTLEQLELFILIGTVIASTVLLFFRIGSWKSSQDKLAEKVEDQKKWAEDHDRECVRRSEKIESRFDAGSKQMAQLQADVSNLKDSSAEVKSDVRGIRDSMTTLVGKALDKLNE